MLHRMRVPHLPAAPCCSVMKSSKAEHRAIYVPHAKNKRTLRKPVRQALWQLAARCAPASLGVGLWASPIACVSPASLTTELTACVWQAG